MLFLPPFVFITRVGSLPFLLLVSALALIATWETYRLLGRASLRPLLPLGCLAAEGLILLLYRGRLGAVLLFLALFFLLLLVSLVLSRRGDPFARAGGALFALFYAAGLPGFLLLIRELPRTVGAGGYERGAAFVFLLFLTAWGSDTGAYLTGMTFGRTPLAPSISPKKTVEGSIGGILFAVGGAFVSRAAWIPEMGVVEAAAVGILVGILSQAGDLIESSLKRAAEVKDSAGFIPGHGGVLDRFDGLFFAAPVVWAYLRFVLFRGV